MRLSDRQARIVAAWWQDGRMPKGLASLASSGAISDDVLPEIDANERSAEDPAQRLALAALAVYCRANGPRGPVAGWGSLGWSGADERRLEARLRDVACGGGATSRGVS